MHVVTLAVASLHKIANLMNDIDIPIKAIYLGVYEISKIIRLDSRLAIYKVILSSIKFI